VLTAIQHFYETILIKIPQLRKDKFPISFPINRDQESIVGVVTRYRLHGLEIKSWRRRDFPHPTRLALGPTQLPAQWVPGLFPKCKVAREWFQPSTPIYCRDKEEVRAIPLLPIWPFMACSRVTFTFSVL